MAAHDPDLESEFAQHKRVYRWAIRGGIAWATIAGTRLALLGSGFVPDSVAVALTSLAYIVAGLVLLDRLADAGPRTIIASEHGCNTFHPRGHCASRQTVPTAPLLESLTVRCFCLFTA